VNHRLDIAWGTDTGTHELPAIHRGVPREQCMTAEIWPPAMRPDPDPAAPARPRRSLRAAARTAYTTLITLGVMTLTGCATVGPDGLADAIAQALR
jgi:hypothetical protein